MKTTQLIAILLLLAGAVHPYNLGSCATINAPGTYDLINDLVQYDDNCIFINSDDVTIDLQSFAIIGNNGAYNAITINPAFNNITIANGTIDGFATAGVFADGATNLTLKNLIINPSAAPPGTAYPTTSCHPANGSNFCESCDTVIVPAGTYANCQFTQDGIPINYTTIPPAFQIATDPTISDPWDGWHQGHYIFNDAETSTFTMPLFNTMSSTPGTGYIILGAWNGSYPIRYGPFMWMLFTAAPNIPPDNAIVLSNGAGNRIENVKAYASSDAVDILGEEGDTIDNSTALSTNDNTIYIETSPDCTISNSHAISTFGYGIWLDTSFNTTIINSTGTSIESQGIGAFSSDAMNISDSSFSATDNGGAYIQSSSYSTITNSNFTSDTYHALEISSSSDNNVFDSINATTGASGYDGIHIFSSAGNTIKNSIIGGALNSLTLDTDTGTNITNCTIGYPAGVYAIVMMASSGDTFLNNNVSAYDSTAGIVLQESGGFPPGADNNVFWNNTIDNQISEVSLDPYSTNNTFFWNTFVGSPGIGYSNYVSDSNGGNFYDGTTPSSTIEGNLWGNVLDGNVPIYGSTPSAYNSSLYIGLNTYNDANSGGMTSGVTDYEPLTPNTPIACDCNAGTYSITTPTVCVLTADQTVPVNTGDDCFDIQPGADGSIIDCNGHSIIGDNSETSPGIGITSQATGTRIMNCNIENFSEGIRLSSSSGSTISNDNISSPNGTGILAYASPGLSMSEVNISSRNDSLQLQGATSGSFTNNTFSSYNTELEIDAYSSGNTFIWNHFLIPAIMYINDSSGSNTYYGSTTGMQGTQDEGNFYDDVLYGVVNISYDPLNPILSNYEPEPPLPSYWYVGNAGTDYPYQDSSSQGKTIGVYDPYAINAFPPIVFPCICHDPRVMAVPNFQCNLTSDISSTGSDCLDVHADNVTIECNGFAISSTDGLGTNGIYTDHFNTTISDCNVNNFQTGIQGTLSDKMSINNTNVSAQIFGAWFWHANNTLMANSNIQAAYAGLEYTDDVGDIIENNTITGGAIDFDALAEDPTQCANDIINNTDLFGFNIEWFHDQPTSINNPTEPISDIYFCNTTPLSASNLNANYVQTFWSANPALENLTISGSPYYLYNAFGLYGTTGAYVHNLNVTGAFWAFGDLGAGDTLDTCSLSATDLCSGVNAISATITNCNMAQSGTSGGGYVAASEWGGSSNTLSNSTISSTDYDALYLVSSTNSTYHNLTLISPYTEIYSSPSSSGNTFYWNNFTNGAFFYADDGAGLGANYWNTTMGGHGEGNLWANVMDGSVPITGSALSNYGLGLFVGSSQYNDSISLGKTDNIMDEAPLTPSGTQIANGSIEIIKNVIGGNMSAYQFTLQLHYNGTIIFNITGNPLGVMVVDIPVGNYSVTEGSYPDYAATFDNCNPIEVFANNTSVCTVNNTYTPPACAINFSEAMKPTGGVYHVPTDPFNFTVLFNTSHNTAFNATECDFYLLDLTPYIGQQSFDAGATTITLPYIAANMSYLVQCNIKTSGCINQTEARQYTFITQSGGADMSVAILFTALVTLGGGICAFLLTEGKDKPFTMPFFLLGFMVLLEALNVGIQEFPVLSAIFEQVYSAFVMLFYLLVGIYFIVIILAVANLYRKFKVRA